MMHTRLALLPALALGFSACGDVSQVVRPNASDWSRTVSPASAAEVIYSNFGPGMAFDANPFNGWTINGFFGHNVGRQAISAGFSNIVAARGRVNAMATVSASVWPRKNTDLPQSTENSEKEGGFLIGIPPCPWSPRWLISVTCFDSQIRREQPSDAVAAGRQ